LVRALTTNESEVLLPLLEIFDTIVVKFGNVIATRQFAFDVSPLTFEHFFFIFYTALDYENLIPKLETTSEHFLQAQIEPSKRTLHAALIDERDPFSAFFYNQLIYASLSQMLRLAQNGLADCSDAKKSILNRLGMGTNCQIINFLSF
jgi:hypothetical protein